MKRRAKDDPGSQRRYRQPAQVISLNGSLDRNNSSFSSEAQACRSDADSGQESVVASDSAVAGAPSAGGLSYPHPKNFAERLMNVLERGIASDCIWWVDEGIHGVVLQPKKLKKGTLLQTHFSGNKYSAFLRSFNRWGFRRVPFHNVPDGAVVYKNCLFRMEKPHLVKHMRMDSDVQDVFERHQLSGGDITSRGSSPSVVNASLPGAVTVRRPAAPDAETSTAPAANNDVTNMLQQMLVAISQGQQLQPPSQAQQQQNPSHGHGHGNGTNSGFQKMQGVVLNKPGTNGSAIHHQGPPAAMAIPKPSQSGFTDMQLLASAQQRAPKTSDLRPPQETATQSSGGSSPNEANVDIFASALEMLVRQMHQGERKQAAEPHRNTLLREILEGTDQYMRQPSYPSSTDSVIRTTLELLQTVGKQELDSGNGKR